jgi:hypothetical protein
MLREAKLAVQQPFEGKRGTFLYDPASPNQKPISPICEDFEFLQVWMWKNGWKQYDMRTFLKEEN